MHALTALLFIFTMGISLQNTMAEQMAYDEVYSPDGTVRPAYRGILDLYDSLTKSEREALHLQSEVEFDGDNRLLMLPRIISVRESEALTKGVQQRADAIMAFFKDHYSGNKKYIEDGIIPEDVMTRIINRSGDTLWGDYIKPEGIAFDYGPDIIRGPSLPGAPDGHFHVVEDNISYVGGRGDLIRAREIMDRHMPGYQKILNSPDPSDFYNKQAASYHAEGKKMGGITIMLSYPKELQSDNEEGRLAKIFEDRGIINVAAPNMFAEPQGLPRLDIREDGIYLLKEEDSLGVRVGHIIGNMNPEHMEPNHIATKVKRILKDARFRLDNADVIFGQEGGKQALLDAITPDPKTGEFHVDLIEKVMKDNFGDFTVYDTYKGYSGIIEQMKKGNVSITNSPGIEFVGDKEFYIYMEELIRYYLDEEPIIKNMESGSFYKEGKLDQKMIDSVFGDFDQWVVKVVDGRGGKGVYVGPKTDPAEIPSIRALVEAEPTRYKWQRYSALSTLNEEFIGDIRVLSHVGSAKTIVAETPWARVAEASGNGKVNISDKGFEAAVMVRRGPIQRSCNSLIKDFLIGIGK